MSMILQKEMQHQIWQMKHCSLSFKDAIDKNGVIVILNKKIRFGAF